MEEQEIDMKRYWRILSQRKWTFLIIFFSCVLFGFITSAITKPVYHLETTLEVGIVPSGTIEAPDDVAGLCKNDLFKDAVKEKLSLPQNQEINMKATSNGLSVFLSMDSTDPQMAVKILNMCTEKIIERHEMAFEEKMIPLKERIDSLQKEVNLLAGEKNELSRLFSIDMQVRILELEKEILSYRKTKIIFPAVVPKKPYKPVLYINLIMGALVGFFSGFFVVFLQEYLFSETKK